jgi:hypothetical protein
MKDMILANDGTIYGGFVRDMVRRDIGEAQFYAKRPGATEQYDDARVMSRNSERRLALPNDIDCYFRRKSDAQRFLDVLTANNFMFKDVVEVRHGYALPVHRLKVTHIMFAPNQVPSYIQDAISVSFAKHFTIDIDLVYSNDDNCLDELPTKSFDFMCNAMYLTKSSSTPQVAKSLLDGTYISNEAAIAYIFADISRHRAVINPATPPISRVSSMLRGGWSIVDNRSTVIVVPRDVDVAHPSTIYRRLKAYATDKVDDDVCLICLEEFSVGQTCLRNRCCNARYHEGCYGKTFDRTARCPQCRRTM